MSARPGRLWIAVAVATVVALMGLFSANAVDQELTPEARSLFIPQPVPFSPDSGWALLAGFHAPPDEKPRDYASALREAAAKRKPGQSGAPEASLGVRAADELLCIPQEFDCVRRFAERPDWIDTLVSDNAVLLARYRELQRSRGFADVVEVFDYYNGTGPRFSTVLRVQQVGLSSAGAAAARGRVGETIEWLEADSQFHRRWLEESGSILTKMLAVRGLSRDFLVAGQVARSGRALGDREWNALERIAAPLTPAERGVARVIRVEATLFAGVLDKLLEDSRTTSRVVEVPRVGAAIASATLRRNATLNFAYPVFDAWTTLDAVPSNLLAGEIARVEQRVRVSVAPDWRWAYNYTGRRFAAESAPSFAEYVYRVRDLDALAATIRCVVALRAQRIAIEATAAFVASSPACVDPYEGRPLAWDPQQAELSFKARSLDQAKRFGGRGDRVAFKAFN